nr:ASKHA domain-containing protein [Desulfovirgula thermocuniculi]
MRASSTAPGALPRGREKFTLVPAEETATGREIAVTQTDIQNFLRTRGAVNAALELLLESVGLFPGDIGRFYAAGAFGEHLDLESAVTIGLYPDLPRERMVRLGNASLEGAKLALLSGEARKEAGVLARRITYIELNDSQAFMSKPVLPPHQHRPLPHGKGKAGRAGAAERKLTCGMCRRLDFYVVAYPLHNVV